MSEAGSDDIVELVVESGVATEIPRDQVSSSSLRPPSAAAVAAVTERETTQLDEAEGWKKRGNEEFKKRNYLEAYDMYTEAIEACPCPIKPEDVLRLQTEFDQAEREKAYARMEEETQQRRRRDASQDNNDVEKEENSKAESKDTSETQEQDAPAVFELEPQENGEKLAIFLNNRAATLVQLERYEEAIKDADAAILLNPRYTKAYMRRSSAFEKTERTEQALRDMKRALELEPSNAAIRRSVVRLQKLEDERLEKLKEETMSKLKDLGNSLLGNFGLSLDNFNTVQDPNTGSYSISFNQNK